MCFGKPLGNIVIRGFTEKVQGTRDTVHGQSKKEWFTVIRSRFTARAKKKGKRLMGGTDNGQRITVNGERQKDGAHGEGTQTQSDGG
jgi:hypothetical protein